jgi:uncharacterized membrane protein
MKLFHRVASGTVLSLNVLLIFFLFFQERIIFPTWLQSVGRMHPLLLHLPIGAIIISLLIILFRKEFKKRSFEKIAVLILSLSAVTAALSAIMGFILSKEGGYDEALLNNHLIAGTCVSLLTWLLVILNQKQKQLFNGLLISSFIAVLVAGHFGATLTHGENFVFAPLMKVEEAIAPITDSSSLYLGAIEPIFRSKCFSCHNPQKKKGNLLMTSAASILQGGKHGVIWKANDPQNSSLIQRIQLPEENEEHMPPAGKTPLTEKEKQLLFQWILHGANVTRAWTKFDRTDTLMLLAKEFIQTKKATTQINYSFPFASTDKIKELNTPYRTVTQLSAESPALAATFFVSQSFESSRLKELLVVKEQLVNLTLAGMPITDADGKLISEFVNLEKLDLNKTKITSEIFNSLIGLKKLKSLSLAGTSVDSKSFNEIGKLPELSEVFIWNTKINKEQLASLKATYPNIQWDFGYPPTETLRLTSPLLLNDSLLIQKDQLIRLKHNLPGTIIRYTLDGTTPDSISSAIYKEPISIEGYTVLKAIACRKEWWSSQVSEFAFFKRGYRPTSAELITAPDKQYKGEGIKTLIDNKKSTADNFRDVSWLGYKVQPLEALFYFENNPVLKSVTVSYCKNHDSYIIQPESIELWAGAEKNKLKLIKKINPYTPKKGENSLGVNAIVFTLPSEPFHYFKIVAVPLAIVPEFISKKKEKGWFFVDEVIFN